MFEVYVCDEKFSRGSVIMEVFVDKFAHFGKIIEMSSCHYLFNFGNFRKSWLILGSTKRHNSLWIRGPGLASHMNFHYGQTNEFKISDVSRKVVKITDVSAVECFPLLLKL